MRSNEQIKDTLGDLLEEGWGNYYRYQELLINHIENDVDIPKIKILLKKIAKIKIEMKELEIIYRKYGALIY